MSYVALYRKFRPDSFADVKGQDHIVTTLRNQVSTGRIGHAYLFTGTRGTGKTTIAKILAKTVNCENPKDGSPCGECPSCKAIAAGSSMNVIEIDAASNNGVDNVREIIEEVSYSPAEGKYKVYIIDEVHMLSTGAFNALLKTLEEPPSYAIFILATTEVHKIPITILSRCQRYDFKHIDVDTIAARLTDLMEQEKVPCESKALRYIAKAADGSMRDALSLLDQCISFHIGEELTYDKVLDVLGAVDTSVFSRLLSAVRSRNVLDCIDLLDEVILKGRELTRFISDFTWYLRNLLIVKTSEDPSEAVDMSADNMSLLREQAKELEVDAILRYIRIFSDLSAQIKYGTQKRVMTEVALIKLCRPQMEKKDDSLLERVRALEEKIASGNYAPALDRTGQAEPVAAPVSEKTMTSEEKKAYVDALPEEIVEVVKRWGEVVNSVKGLERRVLKSASLFEGGGNLLRIQFPYAEAPLHYMSEDYKKELAERLSELVQKRVEVDPFEVKPGEEKGAVSGPELSGILGMEIEEEEEDPDSSFF